LVDIEIIRELTGIIVDFVDRVEFLSGDGFLNRVLQFNTPIEDIFQVFDDNLVKYLIVISVELQDSTRPSHTRHFFASNSMSVGSAIAEFGGIHRTLEKADAVQLIAKTVGKFINVFYLPFDSYLHYG
jgi:hypothetical protein